MFLLRFLSRHTHRICLIMKRSPDQTIKPKAIAAVVVAMVRLLVHSLRRLTSSRYSFIKGVRMAAMEILIACSFHIIMYKGALRLRKKYALNTIHRPCRMVSSAVRHIPMAVAITSNPMYANTKPGPLFCNSDVKLERSCFDFDPESTFASIEDCFRLKSGLPCVHKLGMAIQSP